MTDLFTYAHSADFWAWAAVFTLLLAYIFLYLLVAFIYGGNPLELPIAAVRFMAHACLVVAIVIAMYARLLAQVAYLPFHLWRQKRRRLSDARAQIASADVVAALRRRGAA